MKLDVSATRHPSGRSRLLVSVQDEDGPIDTLKAGNFEVVVWAGAIPFQGGYSTVGLPVSQVELLVPGFYELRLGIASLYVGSGENEWIVSAEDLGAVVFGVMATRGDDRGNAIAVTPLRAEAP